VLLATLSHLVPLVPLAWLSLQELLALQVPHHLPTPLQLTLVLLLATLLVSLVSLPLLPLSSLSSKQPEYLSSLPPSHENTRL
jgi:hypothetical protein